MKTIRAVAFVSQVALACAGAMNCADSPGACKAPKASLMQLRKLTQQKTERVVGGVTAFSSQLAEFQKFADEMVARSAKGGNDTNFTDPGIQQAVITVHKFILHMFEPLTGMHTQDETRITDCNGAADSCKTTHLSNASVTALETYNNTAHGQYQDFITCMTDRAEACGQENDLCNKYDAYRQQELGSAEGITDFPTVATAVTRGGFEVLDPQFLPSCVGSSDSSAFSEAFIKAEEKSVQLQTMEDCLRQTNTWLNGDKPPPPFGDNYDEKTPETRDGLWPYFDNCKRVESNCSSSHTTCKDHQTTWENNYCMYESWWDAKCGAWEHCYEAKFTAGDGECNNLCADIEDRVTGRKADNETGMRIICLLDVLFGKYDSVKDTLGDRLSNDERSNALDDCKKENYTTQSNFWNIDCAISFNLTHLPWPEVCDIKCPHNPNTPEFMNSYYSELGSEVDVLHDQTNGINKDYFKSRSICTQFHEENQTDLHDDHKYETTRCNQDSFA